MLKIFIIVVFVLAACFSISIVFADAQNSNNVIAREGIGNSDIVIGCDYSGTFVLANGGAGTSQVSPSPDITPLPTASTTASPTTIPDAIPTPTPTVIPTTTPTLVTYDTIIMELNNLSDRDLLRVAAWILSKYE